MASWSENSSYQGAASGAATGAMFGSAPGALAGAGIGFVAGGIMGGMQKDAAKRAEEERQKEIKRAIERQNRSEFTAKSQAEQWALADIGVGREDRAFDVKSNANVSGLKSNADAANAAVKANAAVVYAENYKNGVYVGNVGRQKDSPAVAATKGLVDAARIANDALSANEGISAALSTDDNRRY